MSKVIEYLETLCKTAKEGGICHSQKNVDNLLERIKYVKNNSPFKDTLLWKNNTENALLGISISTQKIDIYDKSEVSHNVKDFLDSKNEKSNRTFTFGVDIIDVVEYITKSGPSEGKKRASVLVADSTGKVKVTVWSDLYEKTESIFVKNNSVVLTVERGKGKFSDTLVCVDVKQAV